MRVFAAESAGRPTQMLIWSCFRDGAMQKRNKDKRSKRWQLLAAYLIGVGLPFGIAGLELFAYHYQLEPMREIARKAALDGAGVMFGTKGTDKARAKAATAAAETSFAQSIRNLAPGPLGLMPQGMQLTAGPIWTVLASQGGHPTKFMTHVTGRTQTLLLRFVGIPPIDVQVVANAGIPKMDILMCLETSQAVDDFTDVIFVRRSFDRHSFANRYAVVAQGTINEVLTPKTSSTAVGALPPQNLDMTSDAGLQHKYDFRAQLRSLGPSDTGRPPGDQMPTEDLPKIEKQDFTELLVNISPGAGKGKNSSFIPFESGGFKFNSIETLTEAARGNLESSNVFKSSMASLNPRVRGPQPGIQLKYIELAQGRIQPLTAAKRIVERLAAATPSSARLGLVTFDREASPAQAQCWNVARNYLPGGNRMYTLPGVEMKTDNIYGVRTALSQATALRECKLGPALQACVKLLSDDTSIQRKIVIFMSTGLAADKSDAAAARAAALAAREAGIKIWTVGLTVPGAFRKEQLTMLNADNADPATGGIAGICRNDAEFVSVDDSQGIKELALKLSTNSVAIVE